MKDSKFIIFVLLIIAVITALSTFVYKKYNSIVKAKEELQVTLNSERQEIKIDNQIYKYYPQNNKKIIDINNLSTISDLIKNFKACTITAGIPLELNQTESGVFEIKNKSPLPIHDKTNLEIEIGDKLIGSSFIADGSEVGKVKELEILNKSNNIRFIPYTVVPIVSCF